MKTISQTHPELNNSENSLLFARLILRNIYFIVDSIQKFIAAVIHFAAFSAAIANMLVNLTEKITASGVVPNSKRASRIIFAAREKYPAPD